VGIGDERVPPHARAESICDAEWHRDSVWREVICSSWPSWSRSAPWAVKYSRLDCNLVVAFGLNWQTKLRGSDGYGEIVVKRLAECFEPECAVVWIDLTGYISATSLMRAAAFLSDVVASAYSVQLLLAISMDTN